MMISIRNSLTSFYLAIVPCLGGCNFLPKSVDVAQRSGPWVGRIVTLPVYEHGGGQHTADALLIESGPTMQCDGSIPDNMPILVESTSHLNRLVDPTTLPVGKRVRINGALSYELSASVRGKVATFSRNRVGPKEYSPLELVLLMQGNRM